jgi:hypothetical protein
MRKTTYLILFFAFSMPFCSISQNVELYLMPESVETLIRNPEIIAEDPIIYNNTNVTGINETESRFNDTSILINSVENGSNLEWINNFNIGAELGLSKTSKYLKLPVAYYYKDFSLSLSIPFYLQRQTYYSHGYVSTYGLGDLLLSTSWQYRTKEIFNEVSVNLSFPTGNHNKLADGYLCPLGTGSTDLIFLNKFEYRKPNWGVLSNITYRLSGTHERNLSVNYPDIPGYEYLNYQLKNGNTLAINLAGKYNITNFMSTYAGFSSLINSHGNYTRIQTYSWNSELLSTEIDNANQDFTFIDLQFAIAFNFFNTDLVLVGALPVYTKAAQLSIMPERKLTYFIRLKRQIF